MQKKVKYCGYRNLFLLPFEKRRRYKKQNNKQRKAVEHQGKADDEIPLGCDEEEKEKKTKQLGRKVRLTRLNLHA